MVANNDAHDRNGNLYNNIMLLSFAKYKDIKF